MQRYFLPQGESETGVYELIQDDYHHAIHVMRMTVGERCYLSLHEEISIVAEVTQITDTSVSLQFVSREDIKKEMPYHVGIACAYTKGDKLEWVAQKGTELGMNELIAYPGKTSVAKWDHKKLLKKQSRFEKIVKEAAEQSHRHGVPKVSLLEDMTSLIQTLNDYTHVLIAYEESAKQGEIAQLVHTLKEVKAGDSVVIIFGPEGGLTPNEVRQLQAIGGQVCGLGPRILRAETAPLYALSAMSYQWELS